MTLFNRNYKTQNVGQNVGQKMSINQRRERIVELIKEDSRIMVDSISNIIGVSKRTIERDINQLKKEEILVYTGSSKEGYWVLKKQ